MRRDKNHASVIFWTFGNENSFTSNTKAVLEYAKKKDPTRPRGLPQIGSSQAKETMYHPEWDVDFIAPHYLSPENMREFEKNATKPLVQTEFAHACGNGFNDFEDRYRRMKERPDVWMGGCVWAWIDQSIMHPDNGEAFEKELSLTRTVGENSKLPKDLRRDLPRKFQGNYIDNRHFIDSWGDRATDGIVYGDGTPKDGYWLVKALYGGSVGRVIPLVRSSLGVGGNAPQDGVSGGLGISRPTSVLQDGGMVGRVALGAPECFFLRIGRKPGMCQSIQTMGGSKPYAHGEYLVKPEVVSATKKDEAETYRLRWLIDGRKDCFVEGDVSVATESDGKLQISYDLKPSKKSVETIKFAELGLTLEMPERFDRVDWEGLGPLTSVPGKSKMNSFGKWAMHKDDYRFIGNRGEVKWAAVGRNSGSSFAKATEDKRGGNGAVYVLESGTGNVSFENVGGKIHLTENMAVAGYGGKASGPSGLKSPKDIKMKGSFKVYNAMPESLAAEVVPDLTFTQHYGF